MNRAIIKKSCINTDRLQLMPYRSSDRERLVELMLDPELSRTFMIPDYPSIDEYYSLADKLISFSRIEDVDHFEYGIYLDGYMVGFINDCGFDENDIEIGYVVDPAYKGRGFATEAVSAVICELREMGFSKVLAGFFDGNIGSLRVMEKCGMHLNGNSDEEEYRGQTFLCYECEMTL